MTEVNMTLRVGCTTLLCVALLASWGAAQDRPISGKRVAGFESLDRAVLESMETIGCGAATVAVARDGQLLYSRGYGWCDGEKKRPVAPDALMRIASVTKPITAAAVKNAIRAKQLAPETKVFELLGIQTANGRIVDPRISAVTVGQLLEHRGGWDRGASFDPMFQTAQIEKELQLKGPATPVDAIKFMLARPLQFSPGEKSVYSNFGYCVLGRVLERVMKKPYGECIEQSVCKPLGIRDIKLGHSALKERDAREVGYPVSERAFSMEIMDAHGGLIASGPALCQFLQGYWINGDVRLPKQRAQWAFFGSLPGTTAMVCQREDGMNVAVLLNGRRDGHFEKDNDALKKAIDQALDKIAPKR